jgi:beta-lactamase superfamily II metal-dependent hydrolase
MKKRIIVFFTIVIILISRDVYARHNKYEVHFLDVGQSDCILIKGHNKNYLIDTGAAYYTDKILKYLEENNVNKIDSIILTHYHDDHYGGLLKLVESKKVKSVLIPTHYNEVKSDLYKSLIHMKVKVSCIKNNWNLRKERIDLKVVGPIKEDSNIENNNSIVIQGEIDGVKYLFAADCEKDEEEDMIKSNVIGKCDVLKVPHHSLNTSSTENFINIVNPKVAIITSNGVETPDMKVVERISSKGSIVLRSDVYGNIVVKDGFLKCDKNELNLKLNKTDFRK